MATLITVHGTFAHMGGTAQTAKNSVNTKTGGQPGTHPEPAQPPHATDGNQTQYVDQWWAEDSAFAKQIRQDIQASDGSFQIKPFVWTGDNSESDRRREGERLYRELRELDEAGEKYCLIGHSHGGSVISHALLYSAAKKTELAGLQKWLTVGTPFVHLRKESLLFLRLPLVWKALFVASLMLLMMLLFFLVGEMIDGGRVVDNSRQAVRFGIAILLTTLPFAVFYIFSLIVDMQQLYGYRKSNIDRARKLYAAKWVSLAHEDDEAINGLKSLEAQHPSIFHKQFAVPALTVISAFILPLAYLYVVFSPTLMVTIAHSLRDNVYALEDFDDKRKKLTADQQELRLMRRSLRQAREERETAMDDNDPAKQLEAETQIRTLREMMSDEREKIVTKYDDLPQIQRVTRFKRRFFQENGKDCGANTYCGEGRDVILNSKLLFHLVTDEVSSLVIDEEFRRGVVGNLIRFLIPVLLVPVVFGVLAVAIVFLTQAIAIGISGVLSKIFDKLTWSEIKRSALGNDTETEVALTARRAPPWIDIDSPVLPQQLSEKLTNHSNRISAESLAKFRNAISEIIVADEDQHAANILSFLTWNELIHTSYFEVSEFRKLIAKTLADTDAFDATPAFKADPLQMTLAQWAAAIAPASDGSNPSTA